MIKNDEFDIYKDIGVYIENSRPCLNDEQIEAILEYYNHGEFEMAFEGLLIELMNNNCYPNNFSFANWYEVGKKCEIDILANFDDTVWNKFLKWGQK